MSTPTNDRPAPGPLPGAGVYTAMVYRGGGKGVWHYAGTWSGHAGGAEEARTRAIDDLEGAGDGSWKIKVIDFKQDGDEDGSEEG